MFKISKFDSRFWHKSSSCGSYWWYLQNGERSLVTSVVLVFVHHTRIEYYKHLQTYFYVIYFRPFYIFLDGSDAVVITYLYFLYSRFCLMFHYCMIFCVSLYWCLGPVQIYFPSQRNGAPIYGLIFFVTPLFICVNNVSFRVAFTIGFYL